MATTAAAERKLEEILSDLIDVPLRSKNLEEALKQITALCCEALKSRGCTLVWIDLEQRLLTQAASAGFDEEFEAFMAQRKIRLGAPREGARVDYELVARGDVIKKYNLTEDGGGIANTEIAERYDLQSALCYPLKADGRVIGYLNHFSSGDELFTDDEENLGKIFARQAENIIRQFNRESSLKIAKNLVSDLLALKPAEFLRQLPDRASEMIPDSVCLIWKLDPQRKKLHVVAASDTVDEEYRKREISYHDLADLPANRKSRYVPDVTRSEKYSLLPNVDTKSGAALLSVPMWWENQLLGVLDVYLKFPHSFDQSERTALEEFAALAALSLRKEEQQRETSEAITRRQRLVINRVMTDMSEARNINKILKLLLIGSLELVGVNRGSARLLEPGTGVLEVVATMGVSQALQPLRYKEGISWKAIIERTPQLADDVRSTEWKNWYVESSPETRSELAIPLVVDTVTVREGSKTKLRSRAIGVLNFESPRARAFSETDITYLMPLVRYAALLVDRLEAEQKLNRLTEVARRIIGIRNWREVLQTVVEEIKETLGFEYVNVSLVDKERNIIRTEYVVGIPENQVEQFKKMAVHSLDSNDIQASIVRSRKIEVPEHDNPRFDPELYSAFGHGHLIRVFIPMIASSNGEVIGTVEAGYPRSYRDFIYESDIRFLLSFIAYVVEAIEPSRLALLAAVSHELRASIVGIRGNADHMRLCGQSMSWDLIETKLNDILTDSEVLLLNVGELEYFMGRTSQASRVEETRVFRDIVIKTVNQLKPLVRERGFDPNKIEYPMSDVGHIKVYVDKAKLNQVVYNLLSNSIKYAEDDPESFSIQITVDEQPDKFVLEFADWGMGVRRGLEEKIFESGFRAPEARAKNVSGSGLGLKIARERMRELGGDLILAHSRKPTVFHVLIPKTLAKRPK